MLAANVRQQPAAPAGPGVASYALQAWHPPAAGWFDGAAAAAELWVAIHLPALMLEALRPVGSSSPRPPLAVIDSVAGVQRVLAVEPAAREHGVTPGQGLTAALALLPALETQLRAPRREQALLLQLADMALTFSPRVSLELPDAVLLEVRGSLGLFGGMSGLARLLRERCRALGVTVQLALAPTPSAALAFACHGRQRCVQGPHRLVGALSSLPLQALRWPAERLERLASVGVCTLGEALRLPRAGFTKRFGRDALLTLDRLVGRSPEPRIPYAARERFRARCDPAHELSEHVAILRYLGPLLTDLERYLRSRQSAITALHLRLRHRPRDLPPVPAFTSLTLQLAAPEFLAAPLAALLAEHLSRLLLPAPVIRCELRSGVPQAFAPQSESLWRCGEHGGAAGRESSSLIERLRARLGPDAVYGLCLVPEHRPESAWRVSEPLAVRAVRAARRPGRHLRRPLWLLRAPERLPHGYAGLQLIEGPERIETGWWDGHDVARDYYVARDAAGAQLWVFRERLPPHDWCLHGVFG